MKTLNELEGVVIGIIYKRQPCTGYAVRKELAASPSSHWRASAGAIYPLLARLEKQKLIKSIDDDDDRRGRKVLMVTASGKRAIKGWINDIVAPDLISEISDPVRSRVFLLHALTTNEQIKFAENMLSALKRNLAEAHNFLNERPESEGLFRHLGAIGGVMHTKSRIEFMETVLKQLTKKQIGS